MHLSRTCVPGVFLLAALSSLSGCGASTGPVTAGDEPTPSETPSLVPLPRSAMEGE